MVRWGIAWGLLLMTACTTAPTLGAGSNRTVAATAANLNVQVLGAKAVPAALTKDVLPAAQQAVDDASRRRGIDYFQLYDNPIGLQIRSGADTLHVLSFLGTSKDRNTLNVELRALVGAGKPGFIMNYSGPVTLGRAEAVAPAVPSGGRRDGLTFELVTGLPGGGVVEAYEGYLDPWAERLRQRFAAQPFAFDDVPLVLAMLRSGEPLGYVFCNQGSRLVLGERKYADVQAVTAFGIDGRWLGGYTLVGWNAKTPQAGTNPSYQMETDNRFGTLAQFGELP